MNCEQAGKKCKKFLVYLSTSELIEWCRMQKDALGMTNDMLAEKAKVPKGTIDRIFSPGFHDCKFTTIHPVIRVLLGFSPDNIECDISSDDNYDEIIKQQSETIEMLEAKNDDLKNEIEKVKAENNERINYFKEQMQIAHSLSRGRRTVILVLAISLAFTLFFIIAALIIDKMNPDVGFLWINKISAHFSS